LRRCRKIPPDYRKRKHPATPKGTVYA